MLELLVGRNECKEMRLSYPHYGAIAIEASGFEQKVWVNVSYSGEYVMSGVSDTPIGVDVQKVRRISDAVFKSFYRKMRRLLLMIFR